MDFNIWRVESAPTPNFALYFSKDSHRHAFIRIQYRQHFRPKTPLIRKNFLLEYFMRIFISKHVVQKIVLNILHKIFVSCISKTIIWYWNERQHFLQALVKIFFFKLYCTYNLDIQLWNLHIHTYIHIVNQREYRLSAIEILVQNSLLKANYKQ